MDYFGIMGFIFGLAAFAMVQDLKKKLVAKGLLDNVDDSGS